MSEPVVGETPYELSFLQFSPDPASEERVNIGAMAFSAPSGEMAFRITEHYGRLKSLYPELSGANYRALVRTLTARARDVAKAGPEGSQLALLRPDRIEEVLAQIVPPGSMNFGWSSVRFGVCTSLRKRLDEAFEEFIGKREAKGGRQRRDDEAVWKGVTATPQFEAVSDSLRRDYALTTPDYRYVFRAAWNNGLLHVAEPISLDYVEPRDMVEEATRWRGRLDELAVTNNFQMTAILSDPPTDSSRRQYDQAVHILERDSRIRRIFRESQVEEFANLIRADVDADGH